MTKLASMMSMVSMMRLAPPCHGRGKVLHGSYGRSALLGLPYWCMLDYGLLCCAMECLVWYSMECVWQRRIWFDVYGPLMLTTESQNVPDCSLGTIIWAKTSHKIAPPERSKLACFCDFYFLEILTDNRICG